MDQADVAQINQNNAQWKKALKEGIDAEEWGQSLEALDAYAKLNRILVKSKLASLGENGSELMLKVKRCALARETALKDPTKGNSAVTLQDMKDLMSSLDTTAIDMMPTFVAPKLESVSQPSKPHLEGKEIAKHCGNPKATKEAYSSTNIKIHKIGIKNAPAYVEPRIAVIVVNGSGEKIEDPVVTPVSNRKSGQHIQFDCDCSIQTSLIELKKCNGAIFFEFRHFKSSKRKISTKCYGFLEADELRCGQPIALELYKKPTDFTRKKMNLLSVKELFLHVELSQQ